MSTPIYSTTDNQPKLALSIRNMVALHQRQHVGDAINMVKRSMAEQLARDILERRDFFWERSETIVGFPHLEYGIDVIVLTPAELRQIKQDSFKRGCEHANRFMRLGS